jgi:hypothetical protein
MGEVVIGVSPAEDGKVVRRLEDAGYGDTRSVASWMVIVAPHPVKPCNWKLRRG